MKTARLAFFLLSAAALAAADSGLQPGERPGVVTPPETKPSTEITRRLNEVLPKYSPPPAAAETAPEDPEVLELPKIIVVPKKRPRLSPEIMGPAAFNEKLAKERLSSFDRDFLNKYTLPLFGTAAAERAREDYDREKRAQLLDDVLALARAADQVDPGGAKALREAAGKP